MENTYTDKVIDMKFDKYSYDEEKNISAKGELLVTITLHEYRDLLQKEAKIEASNERSAKYKLETEIKELKREVEHLNAVIAALSTSGSEVNI